MKYLLGLLMVALSGCAIGINVAGSRLDSPESLGPIDTYKVDEAFSTGYYVDLTPDDLLVPKPQHPKVVYDKLNTSMGGGLSLGSHLDLEFEAAGLLKLKYQLLGDSYTNAKAGNFSLAISGGAGYFTEAQELWTYLWRSDKDLFGTLYEGAVIAGYRIEERFMLFGGPFFAHRSYTVWYDPSISSTPAPTSYRESLRGTIMNYGANLGGELRFRTEGKKESTYMRLEFSGMQIQAGHTKRTDVFGAMMVGGVF
jgi:hypothetical protein